MNDKDSTAVDGGFGSRKLLFALFSSILILIASRLCPVATIGEVVTGLVAICGIYVSGNAVVRWQAGNIERARNTMPGVMGNIVEKAVNIAEKKEAKADAKAEAAQEPNVVEAVDDQRG
jgi:hypothetical protein